MSSWKKKIEVQLPLDGLGRGRWVESSELSSFFGITSDIIIESCGIRVVTWLPATDRQLQCAVMLDKGKDYKETSAWRTGSSNILPWNVTHDPNDSAVYEGDSSGFLPLCVLDLQAQNTQWSFKMEKGIEAAFSPTNDALYLEFGGSGWSTGTFPLMVWWLKWRNAA